MNRAAIIERNIRHLYRHMCDNLAANPFFACAQTPESTFRITTGGSAEGEQEFMLEVSETTARRIWRHTLRYLGRMPSIHHFEAGVQLGYRIALVCQAGPGWPGLCCRVSRLRMEFIQTDRPDDDMPGYLFYDRRSGLAARTAGALCLTCEVGGDGRAYFADPAEGVKYRIMPAEWNRIENNPFLEPFAVEMMAVFPEHEFLRGESMAHFLIRENEFDAVTNKRMLLSAVSGLTCSQTIARLPFRIAHNVLLCCEYLRPADRVRLIEYAREKVLSGSAPDWELRTFGIGLLPYNKRSFLRTSVLWHFLWHNLTVGSEGEIDVDLEYWLLSYFSYCLFCGRPIRAGFRSAAGLQREMERLHLHQLRACYSGSALSNPAWSSLLESGEGVSVQLIADFGRLEEEYRAMGTCLLNYASDMESGSCVLFSVTDTHSAERYTAEIALRDNRLSLVQCRGIGNREAPQHIKKFIRQQLTRSNRKLAGRKSGD